MGAVRTPSGKERRDMKTKWKWIVGLAGVAGACAVVPRDDAGFWLSAALVAPLIYASALGTALRATAELGATLGLHGICWSAWAWFAGDLHSTIGWMLAAFVGLLFLSAIVEGLRTWPYRGVG
jgi:hypothetical protein